MKKDICPYWFYVFKITGIDKRGRNRRWIKLGFSINPEQRLIQWKKSLNEWNYNHNGNFIIEEIYRFRGVYCYDKKYLMVGGKNTFYQRRDSDVRQYFFDKGYTARSIFKIRLDDNEDSPFSVEGLDFKDNISDDDIKKLCDEFILYIKDTYNSKYCHILNKSEYDKFIADINSKDGFLKYNTTRFYEYLNSKYGDVVTMNFIEFSRMMKYRFSNKITLKQIYIELCKTDMLFQETKEQLLDVYVNIRNNERSKYIVNDIENWLNNEMINCDEGPGLF